MKRKENEQIHKNAVQSMDHCHSWAAQYETDYQEWRAEVNFRLDGSKPPELRLGGRENL